MKIYTRIVIDMDTMRTIKCESYEYTGPVAMCGGGRGGGKAPTPQAAPAPPPPIPWEETPEGKAQLARQAEEQAKADKATADAELRAEESRKVGKASAQSTLLNTGAGIEDAAATDKKNLKTTLG